MNHDWHFVPFAKTFVNPVVVAKPMSLNGGQPAVIRINNVTPEGFEIRIQEWNYLDGSSVYEAVSYLVIEEGHHVLPNGILVEAGAFEANSSGATVYFKGVFSQVPAVVSCVIMENEPDGSSRQTLQYYAGWI